MTNHGQQVSNFVKAALECSVYLAPTAPGLSHAELVEAGGRLGFLHGEIGDALRGVSAQMYLGDVRHLPSPQILPGDFNFPPQPDYRNVDAFQFMHEELLNATRLLGENAACIDRSVLVSRATAKGIGRRDVEVAITISLMTGTISEKDDLLRFTPMGRNHLSPAGQVNQWKGLGRRDQRPPDETRPKVYAIIKDIIDRRTDGRPQSAEPLDAFSEALETLGYKPFRLWWTQAVAELRRLETSTTPVAAAVAAAALVEGALTFVVKHGRSLGVGVFASKTFDGEPRSWRIDDLVASAASGGPNALLDPSTRLQADALVKVRQRIHAGRMLSEYPTGVPDLRPEEAREAKATAEKVVRRMLDWLQKFPATTP